MLSQDTSTEYITWQHLVRWHGYIYSGKQKGPRTIVLTQDEHGHIHTAKLSVKWDSHTHTALIE